MAPGPVPHHSPLWRDTHSFYLLSPLMGFFSRAWSRLRGAGAPEPWLVETVTGTSQIEAKTLLTASLTPQGHHSQGEAEDGGTPEEGGQAAHKSHVDLKVSSSPLETWGLSDDEEYTGRGDVLRECTADLPTPLPSSLQGADNSPREVEAGKEGVTELAYPSLHWEWCPATEGERDGETVKREGPRVSPCLAPRSKPNTWVYCPGEAEHQATEEKGPENLAREPSTSPSSSGSLPRAWECCSGKESDTDLQPSSQCQPRKTCEADREAEASSSAHTRSAFLKAWVYRPGEDTEEEEEDDSDLASAEEEDEAKTSFCTPPPSDFLKAWVYRPGEDTEEEEDCDWEPAEEEGEPSSCTSPPSAFLKAWVYHPGEDTEEEDEEEEEAQASSATSLPSAFLQAWVCVPGEDTEEEDVCENEDQYDSGAAANSGHSLALQAQGSPLCCLSCPPGKESQEERWREAEPSPFRVAFYLPGQKPALPWAAPKLPLRLQRQLRSSHAPAQDEDPETPLKARKVRFSEKVTVHLLAVWAGPAQAARRGPWEQLARDRNRFARRIAQAQELLGPCFTPASRARAWARLENPLLPLVPKPASSLPLEDPAQATLLIPVVATPSSPPCETPLVLGLGLSGKRG